MVPVTFLGFWGGCYFRKGNSGHMLSAEHPQNFSKENEKEGGGPLGSPPLPYEIRTGKNARLMFFWSL